MLPYQNYLTNQNQNQMYQQNPYQSNVYNPYQQQMINRQPQSIVGRVVEDFSNVTPSDIPMDGNAATFIKRDGSEIQLKAWMADGTISTTSYVPKIETKNEIVENTTSNGFESLNDRFSELEKAFNERFDKLESAITPKTTRKKVDADE